jgi:hypothetical protein
MWVLAAIFYLVQLALLYLPLIVFGLFTLSSAGLLLQLAKLSQADM